MKQLIKAKLLYPGASDTDGVRRHMDASRHPGWPYCPPDEGDLLHGLAATINGNDALQIGLATGSTAAYILTGMHGGKLTSIDYDQDNHQRAGEKLVASMGLADRHTLIEADSVCALPELYKSGRRYGLIFIDGWKTFDRIWVDTFYCAQMLTKDGFLVFDDAGMHAVRKCISLLTRYYGFIRLDTYDQVGGRRQRLWHLLTTRSIHAPYAALRKVREIDQTDAGRIFDFWKPF